MDYANNTIFITIDIDWACDVVLAQTIDILKQKQVAATFFVTHETPLLDLLKNDDRFELGLHPNFQKLLDGQPFEEKSAEEVLVNCLRIVPDATSIRSHSLVQSTPLLNLFHNYGMVHESSLLIPKSSGITLKPYYHWNGLIRVPYYWEDSVYCKMNKNQFDITWDPEEFLAYEGLKIFNFHPIHLYLNTEDIERYERTRPVHKEPSKLVEHKCFEECKGTFVFFSKLILVAKEKGMKFKRINEISV